jgi:ubiquinone/menaquinone biosynthesis C-methylase UbiE
MPASPTATSEQIKDANTRYHDAAAPSYDTKWGIDFGPVGQDQVAGKLRKALGGRPTAAFGDALEIGAGTGYFSLNLAQLGLIERPTATDISAGMLATLAETAAELGVPIATARAEAEELPFADESFDLVFGHAVLHHIPDLPRALTEFERVLRPGGAIAFCGEPSRYGDRLAALPKASGTLLGAVWRRVLGAGAADHDAANGNGHELEPEVDVHAFAPADLRRMLAEAGYESIRVSGEELIANAYGWLVRSLEASAVPDEVPPAWRRFAFRSYLALQRVDTRLLEPRLPAELFYNLVLSARRAHHAVEATR